MHLVDESQLQKAFRRIAEENLSFHPELIEKNLSHYVQIDGRKYWKFSDVQSYCRAVMEAG